MKYCEKSGENRRDTVEKFKLTTIHEEFTPDKKIKQSFDIFDLRSRKFWKISWNLWVFWTVSMDHWLYSSGFPKYTLYYFAFTESIYSSKTRGQPGFFRGGKHVFQKKFQKILKNIQKTFKKYSQIFNKYSNNIQKIFKKYSKKFEIF